MLWAEHFSLKLNDKQSKLKRKPIIIIFANKHITLHIYRFNILKLATCWNYGWWMLGFIQTKTFRNDFIFKQGNGWNCVFFFVSHIMSIICIYKPDPFTSYYYSLNALLMENMSRSQFLLVRLYTFLCWFSFLSFGLS